MYQYNTITIKQWCVFRYDGDIQKVAAFTLCTFSFKGFILK